MQTKFEYMIGDTSKNLIYIIRRITDVDGRLLYYELVESFRKYTTEKKFSNHDKIQDYILSLRVSRSNSLK